MMAHVPKRIHVQLHRTRSNVYTGRRSQALGARVGYWPCLGGPFVQLAVASVRLDVWYGRPSYRQRVSA